MSLGEDKKEKNIAITLARTLETLQCQLSLQLLE